MYLKAAIRYGIPYETFWHLNPRKLLLYQDVYNQNIKEQAELIDYTSWRNGMYVATAIQAALIPKKVQYPKTPYSHQNTLDPVSPEEEFIIWVAEFNRQHEDLPEPERSGVMSIEEQDKYSDDNKSE